MRELVIGASGLVGSFLMEAIAAAGVQAFGTYFLHPADGLHRLDIRSLTSVESCFKQLDPQIVYLAAAMANVDDCERHPGESYDHNVRGVSNVARTAIRYGAQLVYFSSDYVFDGTAGPYAEDDLVNPLCVYGVHKVFAEHVVATQATAWQIVRTTAVYGWEREGKNFVYRLLSTLGEGRTMSVAYDQIGNPTYAPNLAEVVVALAHTGERGIYHVVGPSRIRRDAFARRAAELLHLDPALVKPTRTSEMGQFARRPLGAGLRVDKVRAAIRIPLVSYEEGLRLLVSGRASREQNGQCADERRSTS
jgi:dTDP-4-dehydrorhamnose reductase